MLLAENPGYLAGSATALTARAGQDWGFDGWVGETNGCAVDGGLLNLAITRPRNIAAVFIPSDSDDDGVPDWWARRYFGDIYLSDASRLLDSDGDGVPDWKEYITDTDPASSVSGFKPQCELGAEGTWRIVFAPSSTGRLYTGMCSTNLMEGWYPAGLERYGNGSTLVITYTNPVGLRMLFIGRGRVRVP